MDHPDLSWPEKRLLEVKYLQKRKKFQEALKVLQKLSGLPEVLEAYRRLLLANILDSLGKPLDLDQQRKLCAALKVLKDDSGYFTASIDLALELSIHGDQAEALRVVQEVEGLRNSDWQNANRLRCSALIHARAGDRAQFLKVVADLRIAVKKLKPFHAHLSLTSIAYGLMLCGDLSESFAEYTVILAKFRSADIFIDRFWYLLLNTLINDVTLPATPAALRERDSFFLRYNIVRNLQCGDLENAALDWKLLQKNRPQHYNDDPFSMRLEYTERTAFGRCIAKYLKRGSVATPSIDLERLSPLVATLTKLLLGSPAPLRRPQLIEMLYHQPYSTKFDKRFYDLVVNAKKAGVPIRNRSGAYSISV